MSLTTQQPTLLHEGLATTISQVSTATRFSLRCLALLCEAFFEAAKFSTAASLAIGRRALVTALTSARHVHLLTASANPGELARLDPNLGASFLSLLNEYTALGIYFVHHSFSLAELLTLTTFHLTSSTIKFSLNAAEETVRILDGLFGSTETSRACAAIVDIVRRELSESDELNRTLDPEDIAAAAAASSSSSSSSSFAPLRLLGSASKLATLGSVTKAITAFACLQKLTQRRKYARLPVETIFDFVVDYDRVRSALDDANDDGHDPLGYATDDDETAAPIWESDDEREVVGSMEGMLDSMQLDDDPRQADEAVDTSTPPLNPTPAALNKVRTITTIEELPREESDEPLLRHQTSIQTLVSTLKQRSSPVVGQSSSPQQTNHHPHHHHHAHGHRRSSISASSTSSSVNPQRRFPPGRAHLMVQPHPHTHSMHRHGPSTSNGHGPRPRLALPAPRVPQPTHVYPRQPLVYNISRFLQYSTGAYGKRFLRIFGIGRAPIPSVVGDIHHPNHHAFAAHTGISVNDIVLSSFQPPRANYLSRDEVADAARHNFYSSASILKLEAPSIHPLVHYLCLDHETRTVVLTLRGTLGLSDVLTDLTCDYADLHVYVPVVDEITGQIKGKEKRVFQAHAGMLKNAQLLANNLGPYIKHALDEYPEYGLVLCGHSLGGGVAALLALLWSDRFNDDHDTVAADDVDDATDDSEPIDEGEFLDAQVHRTASSSGLPPGRPLHSFTYGCPCVVSHELSQLCGSLVTSVVHGADIVPCLSLGLVKDLKAMARTLMDPSNKGVAETIITKSLGLGTKAPAAAMAAHAAAAAKGAPPSVDDFPNLTGSDVEEDWLWSLIQTLRADMVAEKLYPAGSVYWLRTKPYVRRIQSVAPTSSSPTPSEDGMPDVVPAPSAPAGYLPAISWPFSSLTGSVAPENPPPAQVRAAAAAAAGTRAGRAAITREERRFLVVLDRLEDVHDLVGELRFSRSMFTDHNPRFYEDGIRALELGVAGHAIHE
ncbi:hypothetical protein AMAG_00669 [Allomyces macrogynus ATCC 38327]|uniref:sn-1-specific diacylglycerol lipase n=1 Tax=Allomyces macrogynus (strain ATCC 38327) TaxID=578462 RepID=A0A0L0RX47_ALLM3|nr:hypothetical protein AMAG_00669 [Allomyces macrogynus ATCC 38327]|eukprot:KNE54710.1 hypothetical protein AMAG_00669 [Allomyces macrogynus ATCC 38327]